MQNLTAAFFAHPFIQRIDEFISPEVYFGQIKEWVQDNCTGRAGTKPQGAYWERAGAVGMVRSAG